MNCSLNPAEIRQAIVNVLFRKFYDSTEKDISEDEIKYLIFDYEDNDNKHGVPVLDGNFENKLSKETINEIRSLQSLD